MKSKGVDTLSEAKFAHRRTNLLFATPLIAYAIEDAERINAALLEEIVVRQRSEQGVSRSNRKGWHSESDFFVRSEPAHAELARAIHNAARDATARVAAKGLDVAAIGMQINGWINVNPPGAFNVPHDHPGSFWSGAYYVKNVGAEAGAEGGGAIGFIDTRSAPAGQPLVQAPALKGMHAMIPPAGMLLLFPSSLRHWVQPNESTEDRVTIAFNVFMLPPVAAAQRRS